MDVKAKNVVRNLQKTIKKQPKNFLQNIVNIAGDLRLPTLNPYKDPSLLIFKLKLGRISSLTMFYSNQFSQFQSYFQKFADTKHCSM